MALGKVMRYLQSNRLFAYLPSYDEIREGLKDKDTVLPENPKKEDLIIEQTIPEERRAEKTRQIREVASHLWGGHDKPAEFFQGMEIDRVEEIAHGRTYPYKFTLSFPGNVRRSIFVKKFDETRLVGLELENILGPYKYPYSAGGCAIFEAEIPGVEASRIDPAVKNTPQFQQELAAIDYRAFLKLIGDVSPLNYLVETTNQRNGSEQGYRMRIIDFDKLFATDKIGSPLRSGFVIGEEERATIIESIGQDAYESTIGLQREQMRRRYLQQEQRINDLLEIVGGSEACNADLRGEKGLAKRLSLYYDEQGHANSLPFYEASDMGELLGLHLREQLNV